MFAKLEHYGVRGIPLNLFKEYLLNHKQFFTVENIISDTLLINCGVSQGSLVLGPLLFLIYINDLHNAVKHTKINHLADDTDIFYSTVNL